MSHSARRRWPLFARLIPLAAMPFACGNQTPHLADNGSGGSHQTSGTEAGISENCGKEFQMCCTASSVRACEATPDLRCNDSACVICSDVPALKSGCTNVALKGHATADLTERNDTANRGPQLAIDGDACTYWGSGDFPSDPAAGRIQTAWQVDLGASRTIDNLTLWLAMTPAGSVNLAIQYGDDGTHWQTEWSGTRNMSGWEPWKYPLSQVTAARYFRIVFYGSPSWASIRELSLYECPSGTPSASDAGS